MATGVAIGEAHASAREDRRQQSEGSLMDSFDFQSILLSEDNRQYSHYRAR
jgi:hypothetical protein